MFFIIVIRGMGVDSGLSMEERMEFLEIYRFLKGGIRWFVRVVNEGVGGIEGIRGNRGIGNEGC